MAFRKFTKALQEDFKPCNVQKQPGKGHAYAKCKYRLIIEDGQLYSEKIK